MDAALALCRKGNSVERGFAAVVLDLDGVVTDTRHLHVQAWKRTFDDFLARRRNQARETGERLSPFDPVADYVSYVDGELREDGIRSFLQSRGITLDARMVHGLGARKNAYYLELLKTVGPRVFQDSFEALSVWKKCGVPVAVVSSSENCGRILREARVEDFIRARVDAVSGKALGLRGKPEPDYFLEAARRLGVEPPRAVVVEDAIAGVEAGRRAGFGWVVGMDRSGQNASKLLAHGADRVITSLKALVEDAPHELSGRDRTP